MTASTSSPPSWLTCKVQPFQFGEAGELNRYQSGQPVTPEVQSSDAAVGVGIDAVPFADGCVGQPVRVVVPARFISGVAEGDQREPSGSDATWS